jgi:hypothetical protein
MRRSVDQERLYREPAGFYTIKNEPRGCNQTAVLRRSKRITLNTPSISQKRQKSSSSLSVETSLEFRVFSDHTRKAREGEKR